MIYIKLTESQTSQIAILIRQAIERIDEAGKNDIDFMESMGKQRSEYLLISSIIKDAETRQRKRGKRF